MKKHSWQGGYLMQSELGPTSRHCHRHPGDPALKNTAGPDCTAANGLRCAAPPLHFLLPHEAQLLQCPG